jgi:hypothetical protein
MGDRRDAYKILVGKPEVIRLLWRPRIGWKNNIKKYITVMNHPATRSAGNFLSG